MEIKNLHPNGWDADGFPSLLSGPMHSGAKTAKVLGRPTYLKQTRGVSVPPEKPLSLSDRPAVAWGQQARAACPFLAPIGAPVGSFSGGNSNLQADTKSAKRRLALAEDVPGFRKRRFAEEGRGAAKVLAFGLERSDRSDATSVILDRNTGGEERAGIPNQTVVNFCHPAAPAPLVAPHSNSEISTVCLVSQTRSNQK